MKIFIAYPSFMRAQNKTAWMTFLHRKHEGNVQPSDILRLYMIVYRRDHVSLGQRCVEALLEELFSEFNSDRNPLQTEQSQRELARHFCPTSMSVGDVIVLEMDQGGFQTWMVGAYGFHQLCDHSHIPYHMAQLNEHVMK